MLKAIECYNTLTHQDIVYHFMTPKIFICFSYLYQLMDFVNARFMFTRLSIDDFSDIFETFFKYL